MGASVQVRLRRIGEHPGSEQCLMEESEKDTHLHIGRTKDWKFLLLNANSKSTSEVQRLRLCSCVLRVQWLKSSRHSVGSSAPLPVPWPRVRFMLEGARAGRTPCMDRSACHGDAAAAGSGVLCGASWHHSVHHDKQTSTGRDAHYDSMHITAATKVFNPPSLLSSCFVGSARDSETS